MAGRWQASISYIRAYNTYVFYHFFCAVFIKICRRRSSKLCIYFTFYEAHQTEGFLTGRGLEVQEEKVTRRKNLLPED